MCGGALADEFKLMVGRFGDLRSGGLCVGGRVVVGVVYDCALSCDDRCYMLYPIV